MSHVFRFSISNVVVGDRFLQRLSESVVSYGRAIRVVSGSKRDSKEKGKGVLTLPRILYLFYCTVTT